MNTDSPTCCFVSVETRCHTISLSLLCLPSESWDKPQRPLPKSWYRRGVEWNYSQRGVKRPSWSTPARIHRFISILIVVNANDGQYWHFQALRTTYITYASAIRGPGRWWSRRILQGGKSSEILNKQVCFLPTWSVAGAFFFLCHPTPLSNKNMPISHLRRRIFPRQWRKTGFVSWNSINSRSAI